MKTTLKVSLLLTLFGTTLATTTPAVATEEIEEICNFIIVYEEEAVYDRNACKMLLTAQAQEIQDLLTQGIVVSEYIKPSDFKGYLPNTKTNTQTTDLVAAFCIQLVDNHPSLGTDEASARRTCEQGMIWEVGSIIVVNSPAGIHSNGAVWAPTWPDDYL